MRQIPCAPSLTRRAGEAKRDLKTGPPPRNVHNTEERPESGNLHRLGVGMAESLEFFSTTAGQLTLGLFILAMLVTVGLMVVRKLRDQTVGNRQTANDLLTNFQELNQQGEFSDAEFRKIKAVLGNQLQRDVKSGKNKP